MCRHCTAGTDAGTAGTDACRHWASTGLGAGTAGTYLQRAGTAGTTTRYKVGPRASYSTAAGIDSALQAARHCRPYQFTNLPIMVRERTDVKSENTIIEPRLIHGPLRSILAI